MSGFSSAWLALREPFDSQARNRSVLDATAAAFAEKRSVAIVDLGSGTGSTLRALSPRLPPAQRWKLVDHDPVLLAEAFALPRPPVALETEQFDLNGDAGPLFDAGADLVTASALLDLVSEPWLANLAAAVAARALPVYIALTYDGRVGFSTADPLDDAVIAAVNAHQLSDKGFGAALGPRAPAAALRIFRALGYDIVHGSSDWTAGAADCRFQIELLSGWLQATSEIGALPPSELDGWFRRRRAAAEAGTLTIGVGHLDFFAQPQ